MNIVRQKLVSNVNYRKLYERMNIQLFDSSLRNRNTQSLQKKSNLFYDIITNYKPQNIEIGSMNRIAQEQILHHPRFAKNTGSLKTKPNLYTIVPNSIILQTAITHGFRHFSFITSVKNECQNKNKEKTSKVDLETCVHLLENNFQYRMEYKTKLYFSCINHCPVIGRLDIVVLLNKLMEYYKTYDFDEYCICDTDGNLKTDDFEYLLNSMILFGIHPDNISVRLPIGKESKVKRILWHCFRNNIHKFDVSLHPPTLTYDVLYHNIDQYLEHRLSLSKNNSMVVMATNTF